MSAELDGRRARRERGRQAVVDAAFALILEGGIPPSAHDVADRAGVSVSSVFRNFDGLADLQGQALDRFRSRYAHFVAARPAPGADLDARIGFFVRHRIHLYEQAGPLLILARMRAVDHATMKEAVAGNRAALAAQTRECFRAEIAGRTTTDAADLISLLDDSIDQMQKTAKAIMLFEADKFEVHMRQMADIILRCAELTVEAVSLMGSMRENAGRINAIAEDITRLEEQADELNDAGIKALFLKHRAGNAMDFIVGNEIYDHLEKITDRFDDTANEIHGIVIEHG